MSSLFQKFVNDSEEAFAVYYNQYHKSIYSTLKGLCKDEALAQDLTQAVFLKLWDRRAILKDEEHLIKYLFFTTRVTFLMHERERKKADAAESELRRSAVLADDSAHLFAVTEEGYSNLQNALTKLSPQQKEVVDLLVFRGLDVKTVAKKMKLAPQTVRNHKAQAILFLRKELLPVIVVFLLLRNFLPF